MIDYKILPRYQVKRNCVRQLRENFGRQRSIAVRLLKVLPITHLLHQWKNPQGNLASTYPTQSA